MVRAGNTENSRTSSRGVPRSGNRPERSTLILRVLRIDQLAQARDQLGDRQGAFLAAFAMPNRHRAGLDFAFPDNQHVGNFL